MLRKIGIDAHLVLEPGHCYVCFFGDEKHQALYGLETTLVDRQCEEPEELDELLDNAVSEEWRGEQSWPSFVQALLVATGKMAAIVEAMQKADQEASSDDANAIASKPSFTIINISDARSMGVLPIPYEGQDEFVAYDHSFSDEVDAEDDAETDGEDYVERRRERWTRRVRTIVFAHEKPSKFTPLESDSRGSDSRKGTFCLSRWLGYGTISDCQIASDWNDAWEWLCIYLDCPACRMSLTETTSFFCDLSRADQTPFDLEAGESAVEHDFVIGASLNGRYVLKNLLGSGGMGMVFLAHDTRLNRHVAIKVIHRLENSSNRLEELLEREAKLGAGINHPNIATVLDFGSHGSRVYSVSEYIEGETLRAILKRRKTMPLDEVCYMISKLAQALDFVHIKGIVHRDLKPENICLATDGTFKILDLGIAHNMFVDAIPKAYFGTPAYSSPEQVDCNLVDGKSDQYALALIAFECLTGTRAFTGTEQIQLFAKHLFDSPPVPSTLLPSLRQASMKPSRKP